MVNVGHNSRAGTATTHVCILWTVTLPFPSENKLEITVDFNSIKTDRERNHFQGWHARMLWSHSGMSSASPLTWMESILEEVTIS